jgi:hypothetical protein
VFTKSVDCINCSTLASIPYACRNAECAAFGCLCFALHLVYTLLVAILTFMHCLAAGDIINDGRARCKLHTLGTHLVMYIYILHIYMLLLVAREISPSRRDARDKYCFSLEQYVLKGSHLQQRFICIHMPHATTTANAW